MWNIVIILVAIVVGLLVWGNIVSGKRKKDGEGYDKPAFRTEEDLEEYGKPMQDRPSTIDPDDREEQS